MSERWCQEGYFIPTNKNQNWIIQFHYALFFLKKKKKVLVCTSEFTHHNSSKVQENKMHFLSDSFYPDALA